MSKILSVATVISMKNMWTLNPIFLSVTILVLSLVSTVLVFKSTCSSWIAFITILTFSSGMMTLFMYTASLSSNEKSKSSKSTFYAALIALTILVQSVGVKNYPETMKMFSNMMMIMAMAVILIVTMMALSIHGHHPNQTVSSSF